jgi:hypothetical protein
LQVSRVLKKIVIAISKWTRDNAIFIVVRPMPTPHCGDLLWSRVALNPSQVIKRSNLSATIVFLIQYPFVRNLHKLEPLTPYTIFITIKTRVRMGVETHTRAQRSNNTHTSKRRERTNQNDGVTAQERAQISL